MAKPQLENGHTQIANEILEHLMKAHLSPNQWQVLLCIIRKTYGFHKKVDYIANKQICDSTELGKTVVSRALHILKNMNIISHNGKVIGLQKDWEQWKLEKLAELPTKVSRTANKNSLEVSNPANQKLAISSVKLAKLSTKVSSCAVTQKIKETITKDNIDDKPLKQLDIVNQSRERIFELLKERRGYNSPKAGAEAKAITWMLNQGYSVENIMEAHAKMSKQPFWKYKELLMPSVQVQIGKLIKGFKSLPTTKELEEWEK